jgi:hypothetical protein
VHGGSALRPSATNSNTHADGDRDGPADGYADRHSHRHHYGVADEHADPNSIAEHDANPGRYSLRR